jgi:hypothetical protein
MQYTEEQVLLTEPSTLTIAQLKSVLSEQGVDLPPDKRPKQDYVDMFLDYQKQLKKSKKRKSEEEHPSKIDSSKKSRVSGAITEANTATSEEEDLNPPSKLKKKRKSVNVFQKRQSLTPEGSDNDNIGKGEKVKVRKSVGGDSILKKRSSRVEDSSSLDRHRPQLANIVESHQTTSLSQVPSGLHPSPVYSSHPISIPTRAMPAEPAPPPEPSPHFPILKETLPFVFSQSTTFRKPRQPIEEVLRSSSEYQDERKRREDERQFIINQQRSRLYVRDSDSESLQTVEAHNPAQHKEVVELIPVHCHDKAKGHTYIHVVYCMMMALLWLGLIVAAGRFLLIPQHLRFCDNGLPPSPLCHPCPEYGICHNGELFCKPPYVRAGKACVQDEVVNRMANDMADVIKTMLMEATGRYQCGESNRNFLTLDEIRKALQGQYSPLKFEEAFKGAMNLLQGQSDKFNINITGERDNIHLSTPLVLFTPLCSLKMQLRGNSLHLAVIGFVALVVMWAWWRRKREHEDTLRVSELTKKVFAELQIKKAKYQAQQANEGYVVVSHLRDHLLKGDAPHRRLWKRVEQTVLRDSRVREVPALLHGAQEITWEWVGTTSESSGRVNSSPSSEPGIALSSRSTPPVEKLYKDVFGPRHFRT